MSEEFVERRKNGIDDLYSELDKHFQNEAKARIEYSEKLGIIENDLKSLSESTKRMAEILERLAIAEERDKTHGISISKLQDKVETLSRNCDDYKESTNKWLYGFGGILTAISFIGTIFGGFVSAKLTDFENTVQTVKIHLELDKPAGWPPESKK